MDTDQDEYSLVETVKSTAKSLLFNDLDKYEGQKLFVWESEVMKRIDLLVPYKDFVTQNVKHTVLPEKADDLNNYLSDQIKHIFFVIPPIKTFMETVFGCLAAKLSGSYSYHIRVLTRIPKQLQELFDSSEVIKRRSPTFEAWPFFWSPTFGDFLLNSFTSTGPSRLLLADDYEFFFLCAWSLLNDITARQFYWHGNWAQQVMQNLCSLKQSNQEPNYIFDQMIVIDRTIDPVTPLLEQFSFSGILDTAFGISVKGVIEVHEEILNRKLPLSESKKGDLKKIQLDTEAYKNLIHLSMNGATTEIRTILRELSETQNAHEKLTSIADLKQYMPLLPKLMSSKMSTSQALSLVSIGYCYHAQPEQYAQIQCERAILSGHFSQSTIIEFIEELIIEGNGGKNAIAALRLISLQALTYSGLTAKTWNEYQKLLVQSFGPSAVSWCLNLQIAGLVYVSGSSSQFAQIGNDLKRLRTVVEEDPMANFYNGYVPLMVRQLEQRIRENLKGWDSWRNERLKENFVATSRGPKRALFVIGGLTRSEIACLRAMQPGFQTIFTTSILKPGDLVDFNSVL